MDDIQLPMGVVCWGMEGWVFCDVTGLAGSGGGPDFPISLRHCLGYQMPKIWDASVTLFSVLFPRDDGISSLMVVEILGPVYQATTLSIASNHSSLQ